MYARIAKRPTDTRAFDIGDLVKWRRIIGPDNPSAISEYHAQGVVSDIMGSYIVVMEDYTMVNFRLQHVLDTDFSKEMNLQKIKQKVCLVTPEFIRKYSEYEIYRQPGNDLHASTCVFMNNKEKNATCASAIFLRFLGSGLRYDYLISCIPDAYGNYNIFPFSKNERPLSIVFQNVVVPKLTRKTGHGLLT